MKGIIALDIDGTITDQLLTIHPEVVKFLDKIQSEDWLLLFITGRNFPWAYRVLKELKNPYILALQNGAILLQMPNQQIIDRKYLDNSIFSELEKIAEANSTDFIVYSGFEFEDICYFRPQNFSKEQLDYLNKRKKALHEKWVELSDFSELPFHQFASVKFIEKEELNLKIVQQIESRVHLHAPLNRDPFNAAYSVAQITNSLATKGNVLQARINALKWEGAVIAAGDDYNDLSMLKIAKIRVVMANAPKDLLALADVVAPPASMQGIVQGLTYAIQLAKEIK